MDDIEDFVDYVHSLEGISSYKYTPKNCFWMTTPPTKPSIEEPLTFKLKLHPSPSHI